jgi:hypothetical protein
MRRTNAPSAPLKTARPYGKGTAKGVRSLDGLPAFLSRSECGGSARANTWRGAKMRPQAWVLAFRTREMRCEN